MGHLRLAVWFRDGLSGEAFQLDAVAAITDLFDGQPQGAPEYAVINAGAWGDLFAEQERTELGAGNRLLLAADKLLANTRAIQTCNDIEVADPAAPLEAWELFDGPANQASFSPHFSVETVKHCANLFVLSNERPHYAQGFAVAEINAEPGNEFIRFTNGRTLRLGEEIGGLRDDVWHTQIKHTIQRHLDKELQVRERGIKVLSLFFIDRVANYRDYDGAGRPIKGKVAQAFEAQLAALAREECYRGQALHLVRETKGTRDFLQLRTSEADKIRCGQQHFPSLAVPFAVVVSAEEV